VETQHPLMTASEAHSQCTRPGGIDRQFFRTFSARRRHVTLTIKHPLLNDTATIILLAGRSLVMHGHEMSRAIWMFHAGITHWT